jgi:hypothetical protein
MVIPMDMGTLTHMNMCTRTDMRIRMDIRTSMDMRTPTGIMESGLVLFLRVRSTTAGIPAIAISAGRSGGGIDFEAVMPLTSISIIPGFMDMALALQAGIDPCLDVADDLKRAWLSAYYHVEKDGQKTAFCPYCTVDSVLGDACGLGLSDQRRGPKERAAFQVVLKRFICC